MKIGITGETGIIRKLRFFFSIQIRVFVTTGVTWVTKIGVTGVIWELRFVFTIEIRVYGNWVTGVNQELQSSTKKREKKS